MDTESRRLMGVLAGVLTGAGLIGVLAVRGGNEPARGLPSPARTPTLTVAAPGVERASLKLSEVPPPSGGDSVRAAALGLSAHPRLEALLADADPVPWVVAAVDALAVGELPPGAMAEASPVREVLVWQDETGRLLVAAGTFRRYREVVDVLESLDPAEVAAAFGRLRPELETAYRAHGGAHGSFAEALGAALARLRGAPLPGHALEVEREGWRWVLADPVQAALAPAEQQLVLMGRANARRAHAALDALAAALGMTEVRAPEPPRLADAEPAPASAPEADTGMAGVVVASAGPEAVEPPLGRSLGTTEAP